MFRRELRRRVVTQVRGEVGLHAGRPDVGEEAVAGAAADRDRAHERLGVTGDADALRGAGQALGGAGGELADGQRVVQFADAAEPAATLGVRGVRHQRPDDAQVQGAGQGVAHTGVGPVGVGVGDVQRDAVPDERVHHAALGGRGRDGGRAAQIERVVGDEQVGAQLHRLVDDLLDGVHREQDPADLLVGVARDGTDRVPGLGPLGGPQGLQRGDDFRQTGHIARLPARMAR